MLKSRRLFPPGGFQFFQPETGWTARPGCTFEELVNELMAHRRANPRFGLPVDWDSVATQVDQYQCFRLAGNPDYCVGDEFVRGPEKKSFRPSTLFRAVAGVKEAVAGGRKVAAGVGALLDWLGDGAMPVAAELAVARAAVCSRCPQNHQGDLTSFFTQPASELIRSQVEIKQQMELKTPFDDKLGVCAVCACPLRLMPWVPLEHKAAHLSDETRARLDPGCWVLSELKALESSVGVAVETVES